MRETPTYEELEQRVGELEAAEVERKKTEAELRESRRKHRTLFETISDAVYVHDIDGRILDFNPVACERLGYDREEMRTLHVTDIDIDHPTRAAVRQKIASAITSGPLTIESRHGTKDGKVIDVELKINTFPSPDGELFVTAARDVTDRKRAGTALRKKENMLSHAEKMANIGSWEWEIATDTVTWSEQLFHIFGFDPADNAPSWREQRAFFHPEDFAALEQAVDAAVKDCKPYELEVRILRNDGETRVCSMHGYPETGPDGRAVRLFGSAQDITDHKQTEDKLRRSEERLRTVLESMGDEVYVHDATGRFILVNEAACRGTGYRRDELLRMDVDDVVPRRRFFKTQGRWPDSDRNSPFCFETRHKRRDGSVYPVEITLTRILMDDGQAFLALARDITKRKHAEEALKESEAQYRRLLDTLEEGYLKVDLGGHVVMANAASAKLFGYPSPEEMLGVHMHKLYANPDDRGGNIEELKRKRFLTNYEVAARTKNGRRFWTSCNTRLIVDEHGEMVGTEALIRDITDRKRAEATLKKSLTEKEVLLREIHHRVKNNMQAISGLLRMHARRTDDAHLTEIFNDCRDRIGAMALVHEALYQSENLAKIDFNAYLKKLCRNLAQAHDAPRRGITLTASAVEVSLDMDQGIAVGMIIAELISNAFKHAFPNDEGGTVSVHLDRPDRETVRLVVSDTGKGLPADFDIRNPSSLGMRLVAGAVTRELGGTMEVERENGARFIIRFK